MITFRFLFTFLACTGGTPEVAEPPAEGGRADVISLSEAARGNANLRVEALAPTPLAASR